jgi:hypothetical protein
LVFRNFVIPNYKMHEEFWGKGHAVVQIDEALCQKPESPGIDSQ